MKVLLLNLSVLFGFLILASSTQAKETVNGCSTLLPNIQVVLEDGDDSDSVLSDARVKLYTNYETCASYLKELAEQDLKQAKTDLFRAKARASMELAKGVESVLNGTKMICPNVTSQASNLQEFACYIRIIEPLIQTISLK